MKRLKRFGHGLGKLLTGTLILFLIIFIVAFCDWFVSIPLLILITYGLGIKRDEIEQGDGGHVR